MKPFEKLVQKFPDARYHEEWNLVTWHPVGILTDERADAMVEFLESEEKLCGEFTFNRFTDMSGYTRIQMSLEHVFTIAKRRKEGYAGRPVKSAFYAVRLISQSIARMYQELMEDSSIEVNIFREREAAAEWLGVPPAILLPPGPAEQSSS
jgi:hypothetical protein